MGIALDETAQSLISNTAMDLERWYMSLTTEYLCPFYTLEYYTRGTVHPWMIPTMVTFTATMI